jgi:hypothetical protein
MDNILAIATYGAQRVKHPHTGRMISAYKMSYSSAASAVLLTVYGSHARNVSSKRSTYHYIQLDGEVMVRHGYILVTVPEMLLRDVEAVCRRYDWAAVFCWRDDHWSALPSRQQTAYTEPGSHTGPDFNPSRLRLVDAVRGEKEAAAEGICVEKSQRSPSEKPWWWLTGDTYPHRELLKRRGARFSGKRKAWYWIGAELPAAIRALVTTETQSDTEFSDEEPESPLLAIFGGRIIGKEQAANGDLILEGENGVLATRTIRINQQEQRESLWEFDLPPQEQVSNRLPAIQKALQASGARYSLYTRKWHFDQPDTVDALDKLVTSVTTLDDRKASRPALPTMSTALAQMIEQVLADDDVQSQAECGTVATEDQPASIRVLKPPPLPAEGEPLDMVQTSIRSVKAEPIAAVQCAALTNGRTAHIDQSYVGELTGSITGQVFCFGYAVHEGICVYVNMAGPRTAVEAIRAKLAKGDVVNCIPMDSPAVELTAGDGQTGMYHAFLQNLPEAKFTSLILCHEWLVNPNYGGKATTFIFHIDAAHSAAKLKHYVTELVS